MDASSAVLFGYTALPAVFIRTELDSITTNTPLATISMLPTELLAMIFFELRSPTGDDVFVNRLEPFDGTIRSVCRLWLHVADSTPDLWERLVLESQTVDLDRLRVVLEQSKNAPIDLTVHLKCMNQHLLSILLPEISRVWFLELRHEYDSLPKPAGTSRVKWNKTLDSLVDYMQQLMKVPTPSLQILKIGGVDIPDDVFSHATPSNLQHLFLLDCEVVPHLSCIFKSTELTVLHVDNCLAWPSLDDFVELLSTLPKLQHLTWDTEETMIPFHNPDAFEPRSVHLPDLRYMVLFLRMSMLTRVVSVLDFPTTTQLSIDGWFPEDSKTRIPNHSLIDALQHALDPHFKSLFPRESEGYTGIHLSANFRDSEEKGLLVTMDHLSTSQSQPIPSFTLGLSWAGKHREVCMEIMMQLLRWHGVGVNVRSLTAKHMHSGFLDKKRHWKTLLNTLPKISSLKVFGACAAAFFKALGKKSKHSSHFVPTLEKVFVQDATAKTVTLMIESIDQRAEARLPKLKLVLTNCEIEAAVLERLKHHGGIEQVRWDENEFDKSFMEVEDKEKKEAEIWARIMRSMEEDEENMKREALEKASEGTSA